MLDHIVIGASDLEASKAFYDAALAPLGVSRLLEFPGTSGLRGEPKARVLRYGRTVERSPRTWRSPAPDRPTVDAFHEAARAAGGRDNGAPGVREIYHPNYYGAFVLDPDGHNIEAVCHSPG